AHRICCLSRPSRASLRCEFEVAICDRSVIALQEDRTIWRFTSKFRAACWAGALDVLVNHLAVMEDFYKDSICGLLAHNIKARRVENNVEALPFAGRLARIHYRRMALVALLAFTSRRFPTLVDSTAIMHADLGLSKAVEHLHFVAPLQIDARI